MGLSNGCFGKGKIEGGNGCISIYAIYNRLMVSTAREKVILAMSGGVDSSVAAA